jgi:hypothetical protein
MASNANAKNKSTESSSSNSEDGSIMTWLKENGMFTLASLTAVGLFIGSYVSTASFLGTKEDWNNIQKKVTVIVGLSIGATIALALAALLYFISDERKAVYYTIIVSTLAIGMSYASIAVASISK